MTDTYRPIPVDFAGPICAECKHAGENLNRCLVFEPKVLIPATRDPVTGEIREGHFDYTLCREQNRRGDCERFEAKPVSTGKIGRGNGSSVAIVTRVGWHRRLAGRIGERLVAWSSGPVEGCE